MKTTLTPTKTISETMDDARKNFKATFGRLLTEKEAAKLTDEIRKTINKEKRNSLIPPGKPVG